jgi:hypothetical protein
MMIRLTSMIVTYVVEILTKCFILKAKKFYDE